MALFEITPKGKTESFAPRCYAENTTAQSTRNAAKCSKELGFLKIRYKTTQWSSSQLVELPINAINKSAPLGSAYPDIQFTGAVAGFRQRLQESPYINN